MGQNVEIKDTVTMGDVLLVDTNRSFTGQDGRTITPDTEVRGVSGLLASRLFELELGIDHVFVLQNTVTVRRPGGWDPDSAARVERVASTFFRHYADSEE